MRLDGHICYISCIQCKNFESQNAHPYVRKIVVIVIPKQEDITYSYKFENRKHKDDDKENWQSMGCKVGLQKVDACSKVDNEQIFLFGSSWK